MFLRELRAFVNGKFATPVPIPEILRNHLGLSALKDEVQDRLRLALGVLTKRALVTM
jgi:hypothetical protein